jgi:tRNA threonylcarbamoyladenosine biosynthesis protein TsaB
VRVLAIETATSVCAAAVVNEGAVISEASLNERYVHAEKLMTQVDAVLEQAGLVLNQLDGIAVSIGPGSFTGLRIGLSVAKGLAYAAGLHIIPVPTLQALAQRVVDAQVVLPGERILAALDARRDEVYAEFFGVKDGYAESLGKPSDVSVATLMNDLSAGTVVVTGDARSKLQPAPKREGFQWKFVADDLARCSAGSVGLLGVSLMARGEVVGAATLEPLYIKEFFFRQHS